MPIQATPTAVQTGGCTDQPILPGGRVPTPLPVSCANQNVLSPRVPVEPTQGTQILTRIPTVEIPGQQKATIEYTMRDRTGVPLDLRMCLCTEETSGDSISAGCGCDYRLVFRLGEFVSGGSKEFTARLVDPENGKVAVDFVPDDTRYPGIYFGEFAVIECPANDPAGQDSTVVFSSKLHVVIGRNLWNVRNGCSGIAGPPSFAEVRLFLRDTDPNESFLLENLAFSDEEITLATYLPVQYWNETPPPIGTYNTANFPFRYHWLIAITAHLFLIAAEQQRRNNLAYSAGGVQINDQNREANYEQAAKNRMDEWKTFVRTKKVEININNCWGSVGSPYYHPLTRMYSGY